MGNRSADATIKGYYYQFDTTILKLLELANDSNSITIEGVEDIDVHANITEAVQCKYLSKKACTNSIIREPIMLMLDHFKDNKVANDYQYTLYAHFEDEKAGDSYDINLEKLKEILTYKENGKERCYYKEFNVDDIKLNSFLTQFKLVFGEEFEKQQKITIQKLKKHFDCSDFTADNYYYNNALRIIIDKARKKNKNEREISKSEFLTSINCSKILFNEWYIKQKSKKDYLAANKQNLKKLSVLIPSKSKALVIGNEIINKPGDTTIGNFIETIIEKYYKVGYAFKNAYPLTIIIDTDIANMTDIKKKLIRRGIVFNDGYEHLIFSPAVFDASPIINTNRNNQKISKASYTVKVLLKQTFLTILNKIEQPKFIIDFSGKMRSENLDASTELIEINYCDSLQDILNILL